MKKIAVTIFLFSVIFQIFSQVDSIETEILNYNDSKAIIISKGRSFLLDKFLENDMRKVKEIKDYLIEKGEDENHVALLPAEYRLILYWTNEFDELLENIKTYNVTPVEEYHIYPSHITRSSYSTKIYPLRDMLYSKLLQYSKDNEDEIMSQISASNLDMEKKQFLQLNFESMVNKSDAYQDILNTHADDFLKTYPESEYNYHIRRYIRYKFVQSNWGGDVEVFGGYSMLAGGLADGYKNYISGGGAINIYYKKIEFILRMYGGSAKTKKEFEYSTGKFEKDSTMSVFLPEVSVGYGVLDNHRFKIAPFLGVGGIFIKAPSARRKEIPELKELNISAVTCNFGVSFDLIFGKKDKQRYNVPYYYFLRLRYNFCLPIFLKKNAEFSGNMHTVTLGVGIFFRDYHREY
jgi:hypothetical protein